MKTPEQLKIDRRMEPFKKEMRERERKLLELTARLRSIGDDRAAMTGGMTRAEWWNSDTGRVNTSQPTQESAPPSFEEELRALAERHGRKLVEYDPGESSGFRVSYFDLCIGILIAAVAWVVFK